MAIENLRTGGGLSDLGQLLAPLLGQRGGADLLALLQLQALWREVVGAQLARHSRPAELRAGRLTITVSSATWNSTLRSMERRVLATIQQRCPSLPVRSLRVVVGPLAELAEPRPTEPRPAPGELAAIPLSAAACRLVEETAARIDDDALRAKVTAAMTRQLQLRAWRLSHGWTLDARGELQAPATS